MSNRLSDADLNTAFGFATLFAAIDGAKHTFAVPFLEHFPITLNHMTSRHPRACPEDPGVVERQAPGFSGLASLARE